MVWCALHWPLSVRCATHSSLRVLMGAGREELLSTIAFTLVCNTTWTSERIRFSSRVSIFSVILFRIPFRWTFLALQSIGGLRSIQILVDVHHWVPWTRQHLLALWMPGYIAHNVLVPFDALFDFTSQCVIYCKMQNVLYKWKSTITKRV